MWAWMWDSKRGYMARVNVLSARTVSALRKPGRYVDGMGLQLRIDPKGNKSWIFRHQHNGRRHDLGLGSWPEVTLAEARNKALTARRQILDGDDPIVARRANRARSAAITFQECAERYIAAHSAGWRSPIHAKQWPSTLTAYVYPVFGALPVQDIDVGLVLRAIEPIWTTKPETAGRVRGRIEAVLDWAKAREYRQGENPARWRGHLDHLLPARGKVRKVEHHAALPYPELPAFMAELRRRGGVAARAMEFAILTVARTGEVIGATWSDIDREARVWTIPASRMKSDREHRVPLSDAALAVLPSTSESASETAKVFPISNMAMAMTLRRMGRGDLTVHGFRSSFSDWTAERTDFPSDVREMALAHVVSDKVEAAYRRGDLFEKHRALANAWAHFCSGADG
jgi:integrase